MEFKHNLIFNGKKYELTVGYMRAMQVLPKIPQEIGSKLLKNEDYTVESQVQLEVFQRFLEYWKDSKEPEINSDNLFQYYLLSQEFGLMKDCLTKYTNNDDFHLSSLLYLDKQKLLDKSDHERYIALHLDSFLTKYEEKMLKIPINSLRTIFFHKERVLNDHQKAFDFINKNKKKDSKLLILLPSLDSEQINHEDVINSISKAQENIGFMPHISPSIFHSYDEQIDQLTMKNNICQRVLNNLISFLLVKSDDKEVIISILYEDFYDVNTKFIYENEKDRIEITPLQIAIELNDIDLFKYLLAKPEIDLNVKTISKRGKNIETLSFKLFDGEEEEKIELENLDTEEERSILYHAIEKENIEMIKLLLDCPKININEKILLESDVITFTSTKFSSSAHKLLESIIPAPETILQSEENLKKTYRYSRNRNETNAFHLAIKKNNLEIVKLLLSRPELDINSKTVNIDEYVEAKFGSTKLYTKYYHYIEISALHVVIDGEENIEIINYLLSHPKLDINIKSISIHEIEEFSLLAAGIIESNHCSSPLLNPLSETGIPFAKQIIELVEEREEKPALYYAIETENFEVVKLLLSRKELDINSIMLNESHFKLNLSESEQLKIREKANENITKFINNFSPIYNKPKKIVETSLHLAVRNKSIKIIDALLKNKNINIKITNEKGEKPIDLTKDKKIIELFNTE